MGQTLLKKKKKKYSEWILQLQRYSMYSWRTAILLSYSPWKHHNAVLMFLFRHENTGILFWRNISIDKVTVHCAQEYAALSMKNLMGTISFYSVFQDLFIWLWKLVQKDEAQDILLRINFLHT